MTSANDQPASIEFEITGAFLGQAGVYAVVAVVTGSTGIYEGPLPDSTCRVRYVGKPGELEVRGRRYGYPGDLVFLGLRPVGDAHPPEDGDKVVWDRAAQASTRPRTEEATDRERARQRALEALKNYDESKDYVWDGVDEDDRPLTDEELDAGFEAAKALNLPAKFKVVIDGPVSTLRERARRWLPLFDRMYADEPVTCPECGHAVRVVVTPAPGSRGDLTFQCEACKAGGTARGGPLADAEPAARGIRPWLPIVLTEEEGQGVKTTFSIAGEGAKMHVRIKGPK